MRKNSIPAILQALFPVSTQHLAVIGVAFQKQQFLLSNSEILEGRADKPMARVPTVACRKTSKLAAFTAVPYLLFILPDQCLHVVKNMCIYTHI